MNGSIQLYYDPVRPETYEPWLDHPNKRYIDEALEKQGKEIRRLAEEYCKRVMCAVGCIDEGTDPSDLNKYREDLVMADKWPESDALFDAIDHLILDMCLLCPEEM